jgi:hypothetical protein
MGSRVMHYCVSTILTQKLNINDSQFLLGGLAPDVHKGMGELKDISHFMKKDEGGVGYVDHHSFYDKYLINNTTPFSLGYYFHLLTDDIWLKEVYYKKIKWLPQDIKSEAKRQYYRDFWILNGKLIDYYCLELLPLNHQPVEISEIDYLLLPELVNDLESDFIMADCVKGEPLEILEMDEVIQVMEKTVTSCIASWKRA